MKIKNKTYKKTVKRQTRKFDIEIQNYKDRIGYYKDLKQDKIYEKEEFLRNFISYDERFDAFIEIYGERLNKIPNLFYSLRNWKTHRKYMNNNNGRTKSYVSEDEDGYVLSEKILFNVDLKKRLIQLKVYDYSGKRCIRNESDCSFGQIHLFVENILKYFSNKTTLDRVDMFYEGVIKLLENDSSYIPEGYDDDDFEFIIYKTEENLGKVTLLSKKEQNKRFKYLIEGEKLGML